MSSQLLLGRYHIKTRLGGNDSIATLLAEDQNSPGKPLCVIKQLKPQQTDPLTLTTARHLFHSEVAVLSRLGEHNQIPRLLAHFETEATFYLVQQFIPGHSLHEALPSGQCWSEAQVIALLRDVLTPLSYIHQQGVIHHNLKPSNLIQRQRDQTIVLSDIGTLKSITTPVIWVGEQAVFSLSSCPSDYSPAEQLHGTPNFSSDVYALGLIALQALTGRTPPEMPTDPATGEILWVSPEVSPALASILDKMVRYAPQERYTSATEALAALKQLPEPVLPGHPTRRKVLQLLALAGTGLGSSVLLQRLRQHFIPNQSFSETLGQGLTLEMIFIPGGQFLMGSPESKNTFEDATDRSERPQHRVSVPTCFMGKYEVTNAQWRAVMGTDPASRSGTKFRGGQQPVINVPRQESMTFCEKLSTFTGRRYRLPTEAEWEYACRAGSQTLWSFGDEESQLAQYAWYGEDLAEGSTHPVGQKQPNPFGLYDMHGNVWEWCLDPWHENYEGAPTDGRTWLNRVAPDGPWSLVVARGGSWCFSPRYCRSACRIAYSSDDMCCNTGFRVVCVLPRTS